MIVLVKSLKGGLLTRHDMAIFLKPYTHTRPLILVSDYNNFLFIFLFRAYCKRKNDVGFPFIHYGLYVCVLLSYQLCLIIRYILMKWENLVKIGQLFTKTEKRATYAEPI